MSRRLQTGWISSFSGLIAVALWVTGAALMGTEHVALPGGLPEESANAVLQHFTANEDATVSGSWLFMIGGLAFIWFVGILRARLVKAEGDAATFSSLAFGGGVATGICLLGMASGGLVTALGNARLEVSAAQALNAVEAMFFVIAELCAVVLVAAVSLTAAKTRVFARWWAVVGGVLAVWLLIAPIGWVGLLAGVPLWTIGTNLMLLRGARSGRLTEAVTT